MEETGSQTQRNSKPRAKSILKQAVVVSRSERLRLRALADSLHREFVPQNPFEQFIFEKLIADGCRLAKIYEYEQKQIFAGRGDDDESRLRYVLQDSEADRFLRYKNSIEKDIRDGYARLKELKNDRIFQ